ncbi:MAG: type II toxin-antitoxin system Phd/YefM family antitoxin [Balneolaceae bacterium]|nr:type II toxin-antitoxin system Phd/YefM family antitoxin [Balneolaceae bacterium]
MKTHSWQVQEAKNRFSELVRKASEEGPQTITKHGKESAVVLSMEDYKRLKDPNEDLVTFFGTSPLREYSDELDLKRDPSEGRDVEL